MEPNQMDEMRADQEAAEGCLKQIRKSCFCPRE